MRGLQDMAAWTFSTAVLVCLTLEGGQAQAKEFQLPGLEDHKTSLQLSSYWSDLDQEISAMLPDRCSQEHYYCGLNVTEKNELPCDIGIPELCQLCHCDPACRHYGDCCLDYAASIADENNQVRSSEEDAPQYDCVSLDFRIPAGILMVSSCLRGYWGTEEDRLCHQEASEEEYSYILDLAVTSSASNTTYVNYYCASCNDDAYSLVSWDVTINCTYKELSSTPMSAFVQDARYMPGMRMWSYNITTSRNQVKQATCFLQVLEFWNFLTFLENFGSRMCSFPKTVCDERARGTSRCMEQVRNCDPTWTNPDEIAKCQQYSLIMTVDNLVYKNPHCAVCNYVNLTNGNADCLTYKRSMKRNRFQLPPSFSALMDFSRNQCDGEQFYDPINKKCTGVKCGSLFTRQNGECVWKTSSSAALSNSSVLNNACPKMVVAEDQFIVLSDGSVYVNSSNKVYRSGGYEVFNDSQILICNEEFVYLSTITRPQKWVTFAVLLLSLVCLLAHITIYLLLPKMRNLPGRNLFSLSCSLFLAHFLFLISTHATEHNNLCIFMGLSLHYFWLASFCWMNVMSLDVYITFRGSVRRGSHASGKTYLFYSVYAWGIPLLVILSALCVQFTNILPEYKPKYAGQMCWINNRDSLVLFFLFPIGAIVLENVALFIVTSYGIYQQIKITKFAMKRSQSVKDKPEKETSRGGKSGDVSVSSKQQKKTDRKERIRFLLYIKLGVIQGLAWTTGFLAAFTGLSACWYLFTILNGLQGFFIFLSFDMKKKVWESLLKKLTSKAPEPRPSKETRTTNLTASTSSGRKQSAKSQRSTTSLLGARGSGCRRRGGLEVVEEEEGVEQLGIKTDMAEKKENNGGEVDSQNIIEQNQGSTKGVLRWDDHHIKSCPVMEVHREKPTVTSCRFPQLEYHGNVIMPCSSDDTLHKAMNKSVQRSFEIQTIVDLLQQIKKIKGANKGQLETKPEMNSDATAGNHKSRALYQINDGYETDNTVMTRNRSLVARRTDDRRPLTSSVQADGHGNLQHTTAFLMSRVKTQPPKTHCLQTGPKAAHPSKDDWSELGDQCSVEQLSLRHSQEQVSEILATRLKQILLSYDDSLSPSNHSTNPDGGQRGRCLSGDADQTLPKTTPKASTATA